MAEVRAFVGKFSKRLLQSAVGWSLVATLFRALSGVLILPLMVRRIPSPELGLWYVFLTLQGIAALFDLGFSPAVTRAAGYIWAGARELREFGIVRNDNSIAAGSAPNYELLNRLIATMRLYYRFFGGVSGLVMLVGGGAWIWIKTADLANADLLRFAYALFVIGGFLNATGDLWPALLSGINGVQIAQKILVGAAAINLVTTGIGLLCNFGIWALVLGTVASGLFIRLIGRLAFYRLGGSQLRPTHPHLELIRKLWPMAWRSGIVSLGSFLVLSANTLICSAFLGLKVTASYGLSLSLISMLTYASSTFIQIKLPIVNQLRTNGNLGQIVDLWIQRTKISVLFYAMGGLLLLIAGNPTLHWLGSKTELLRTSQLALALVVVGLEMHHVLYAVLVVSENENPFVAPALISGAATVALSVALTPHFGVWGMLVAQAVVQASFNNWWTVARGIRGLDLSWRDYWRRYLRQPIQI